ncbi:CPBP family intramembrane metalloprotease [Clostridium bowmanii]|uniref:CPBP family intramembrane glutamic endopeptidase n=1 Tax=Clostridium bowmanii TaxID=132925 RepID=UPI001C0C710D|nr:type II CAAX endopeptidase family protein [Clostridium bowmanii]MBU3188244.1 CPBP family intramembrane metalloprotease [Clostridium bowmanii]MCA1072630.1 CPBP family intramembrane metalloprotease [Clostridium bowmanii]
MNRTTKKVLYFIMFTYVITLLFFLILQVNGGKSSPISMKLLGITMVFPLISFIIVQKIIFKQKLKDSLGISFKFNIWFLFSILIPMLIAFGINVISIIKFSSPNFFLKTFIINIIIGLSISAISALIEEFAWRGFLFNELKHIGAIKSSLIIGVIWALWHTPIAILYKYPNDPLNGAMINFVQMFVISIIITYIRKKSESIFAAAIMHGMFNTMILSSNMDDYITVFNKILLCILVIIILYAFDFYYKRKQNIKECKELSYGK